MGYFLAVRRLLALNEADVVNCVLSAYNNLPSVRYRPKLVISMHFFIAAVATAVIFNHLIYFQYPYFDVEF